MLLTMLYYELHDYLLQLMLSEVDYSKIMQILNENLSEGAEAKTKEALKTDVDTAAHQTRTIKRSVSSTSKTIIEEKKPEKQAHIFLRFSFTMESLVINLFKGGTETVNPS